MEAGSTVQLSPSDRANRSESVQRFGTDGIRAVIVERRSTALQAPPRYIPTERFVQPTVRESGSETLGRPLRPGGRDPTV